MADDKDKLRGWLRKNGACREGREFALQFNSLAEVLDALCADTERFDWLIWMLEHSGISNRTQSGLSARFIREIEITGGRHVFDLLTDERSRRAVEVSELYATGNATDDDLSAASAAAWDAASAAASAAERDAARAAAWAAASAAAKKTIGKILAEGNPFR